MSHWTWNGLLLALMALVATACMNRTAGPKVSDYQAERAAAIEKAKSQAGVPTVAKRDAPRDPATEATEGTFGAVRGGAYVYDPIGKRDPFRSFILDRLKEMDNSVKSPLEQFDLSQLKVGGVVWETNRRRALILDPSGQNYVVQEGDPIGKNEGRVISIGDSRVVVREAYEDFHGEKTTKEIEMRVRQSQGG